MVRTQNMSTFRRYRNPTITVRQTIRNGVRIPAPVRRKKRVSPIRRFFRCVADLVKLGLFVGAAVFPITCIFVIGWLLIN